MYCICISREWRDFYNTVLKMKQILCSLTISPLPPVKVLDARLILSCHKRQTSLVNSDVRKVVIAQGPRIDFK